MTGDRVQCHLSHGFSKVGKRCELSGEGLDVELASCPRDHITYAIIVSV